MNDTETNEKALQEFAWKRKELVNQLTKLKKRAEEIQVLEEMAKSDPAAAQKLEAIEKFRDGLVRAFHSVQSALAKVKQVEQYRSRRKHAGTHNANKRLVRNLNQYLA